MIPDGNLELHEKMKKNRNGNYMSTCIIFSYMLNLFKTKLTVSSKYNNTKICYVEMSVPILEMRKLRLIQVKNSPRVTDMSDTKALAPSQKFYMVLTVKLANIFSIY